MCIFVEFPINVHDVVRRFRLAPQFQHVLYFRIGYADSFETWKSNAIRINFDMLIVLLFSDRQCLS